MPEELTPRVATCDDLAELTLLMRAAIDALQAPFLTPEEIVASRAVMGLDTQLIDDGTYFVVESDGRIVGCGGWSRRATLYGGDATAGRDRGAARPGRGGAGAGDVHAPRLHPARHRAADPVALRGRRPRRGVPARRADGDARRRALYRACGYLAVERLSDARGGVAVPLVRMAKPLV